MFLSGFSDKINTLKVCLIGDEIGYDVLPTLYYYVMIMRNKNDIKYTIHNECPFSGYFFMLLYVLKLVRPCRDIFMFSVIVSHAVGRGFATRPGHIKDPYINDTNCLPAWHAGFMVGVLRLDCVKGRVVCGTVYGDMHYKDLLGSIVRVGYCVPIPDFYLLLHTLRCTETHSNGYINQS